MKNVEYICMPNYLTVCLLKFIFNKLNLKKLNTIVRYITKRYKPK